MLQSAPLENFKNNFKRLYQLLINFSNTRRDLWIFEKPSGRIALIALQEGGTFFYNRISKKRILPWRTERANFKTSCLPDLLPWVY